MPARLRFLALCLFVTPAAALAEDAADLGPMLDKIRKGSPAECVEVLKKLTPGKEERAAKPIAIRLVTETDAQAREELRAALAAYKGAVLVQAVKTGFETKGVTDDFRLMLLELLKDEKSETAVNLVGKVAFESEMKAVREAGQKALVAYGDAAVKCAMSWLHAEQKIATEAVGVLQAIDTVEAGKALAWCMADGGEKELNRILKITSKTRDDAVTAMIAMGDEAVPGLLAGLDNLLTQKWSSYVLQKISGEFYTQKDKAGWLGWWKRHQAEKAGK